MISRDGQILLWMKKRGFGRFHFCIVSIMSCAIYKDNLQYLQSLKQDLQGTVAALLLWESGKGGECSWSCCKGIGGRIWASSDVPQNAIDALLDYFHDGPSQRASLGAAAIFETLRLLWVWIHKRNNLLGEYEFSNKTICSMSFHAIQSRTWTLQFQVIMCVHIFSCLEWRGHVKECGEVCG